jgi:hypothetical protein
MHLSTRQTVDRQVVRYIVNSREIESTVAVGCGIEAKRAALAGIDVVLAHEFSFGSEFDDLTRVRCVGIHRIPVCHEQMAIWGKTKSQRTAKMRIREYQVALIDRTGTLLRVGDGKYGVIGCRRNKQNVMHTVQSEAGGTQDQRAGICDVRKSACDGDFPLHRQAG